MSSLILLYFILFYLILFYFILLSIANTARTQPYLRACPIQSLNNHSQAFIFTTLIPEIAASTRLNLMSVNSAVFRRMGASSILDIVATRNPTSRTNATLAKVSSPTRIHNSGIIIINSSMENRKSGKYATIIGTGCMSLETRLITCPDETFANSSCLSCKTCKVFISEKAS